MTAIRLILADSVGTSVDPVDRKDRWYRRNLAAAIKEAATVESLGDTFQRLAVHLHPADGDPIDVEFCFEDAPVDPLKLDALMHRAGTIVDGLRHSAALLGREKSAVIVPIVSFAARTSSLTQDEQERAEQRLLWAASWKSLGEHYLGLCFGDGMAIFQFGDYRDDVNGRRVRELASTTAMAEASA